MLRRHVKDLYLTSSNLAFPAQNGCLVQYVLYFGDKLDFPERYTALILSQYTIVACEREVIEL